MRPLLLVTASAVLALLAVGLTTGVAAGARHRASSVERRPRARPAPTAGQRHDGRHPVPAVRPTSARPTVTSLGPGETKVPGRRCWSTVQPPDGQACPQATDDACTGSPLQIGACMAARRGWFDGPGTGNEWACVVAVGNEESNWDPTAQNASGAYGIPQALPASKLSQAGPDWRVNPRTQLIWMYDDYLIPNFGTPCARTPEE